MPRGRSEKRETAYEIWQESGGKMLLKDIATRVGVSDGQIRRWKSEDRWDDPAKSNVTKPINNVTKRPPLKVADSQTEKTPAAKSERLKEATIVALLTSSSIEDAAQSVGISETTIYRWLKMPDFQDALTEAKREAVRVAVAKLQQGAGEAVDALKGIMSDSKAPASARVSAAKTVIDMALKSTEIEEITKRIDELERTMEKNGAPRQIFNRG